MTIQLKCTCGTTLTATDSMAGKRGRCKKCGHTFTVPKRKPVNANDRDNADFSANDVSDWLSEGQEEPVGLSIRKDFARDRPTSRDNAAGSSSRGTGKQCPECAATICDATVCMHCGYHTRLKRKLKTLDSESISSTKWFIFLTVFPICLIYVIFAYLSLDSMTGPTFLIYFIAGYCVFGLLIPILRSVWLDSDIFNYLAVGAIESAGAIRLAHALLEGNLKISFLLLGIAIVPLAFLLPRTENANEFSKSFRSKQGGLAMLPYGALFAVVLAILGAVYFVQPVSQVVASLSLLFPGSVGFAVFATLNPTIMDGLGGGLGSVYSSCSGGFRGYGSLGSSSYSSSRSSWGRSGYSSWSSCGGGGGGCGGGCGGGGCGGGGCGG